MDVKLGMRIDTMVHKWYIDEYSIKIYILK